MNIRETFAVRLVPSQQTVGAVLQAAKGEHYRLPFERL